MLRTSFTPLALRALAAPGIALLASCGGGSGGTSNAPAPAPASAQRVQVSTTSSLAAGCGSAIGSALDAFTPNSAVQPQVAADPAAGATLYTVWEQDRWNAIGTRAIDFAASTNGGATWGAIAALPFSACGGGAGAGFDRASDPSITVGKGGIVLASALALSAANYLASGGTSAVMVSRSLDGGASWQAAVPVILDTGSGTGPWYFNDRDAIAADPNGPDVYIVWDRLTSASATASSPTWLAHSGDSGATWDAARLIYDPGAAPASQTFNNQPLVLPDGSVLVVFSVISGFATELAAIRSTDHGASWPASGAATVVASLQPVGAHNPISGGPPIRDSAFMAQTAVDPAAGTVAAVWQDGRFSSGARDGIVLSLSADKGTTWTAPVQVNTVKTAAAFDPAVHFGSGGRIAVTYYDFRDYVTGSAVLSTSLWLVQSSDGGQSWTETRLGGPFDLNQAPPADLQAGSTGNALFLGDQQGLSWTGTDWVGLNAVTTGQGSRIFAERLP
jgi:hypothetical protein